uniref:Solanesyl diphosphate synthase n=1 Tax=Solanum tuberosum TaxID=4113 RepID=M1AAA5_SOLTU
MSPLFVIQVVKFCHLIIYPCASSNLLLLIAIFIIPSPLLHCIGLLIKLLVQERRLFTNYMVLEWQYWLVILCLHSRPGT